MGEGRGEFVRERAGVRERLAVTHAAETCITKNIKTVA